MTTSLEVQSCNSFLIHWTVHSSNHIFPVWSVECYGDRVKCLTEVHWMPFSQSPETLHVCNYFSSITKSSLVISLVKSSMTLGFISSEYIDLWMFFFFFLRWLWTWNLLAAGGTLLAQKFSFLIAKGNLFFLVSGSEKKTYMESSNEASKVLVLKCILVDNLLGEISCCGAVSSFLITPMLWKFIL